MSVQVEPSPLDANGPSLAKRGSMTTTTGSTHVTPPERRRSTAPITAAVALCLVSAAVIFAIVHREKETRDLATPELASPVLAPLPLLTARSAADIPPPMEGTERALGVGANSVMAAPIPTVGAESPQPTGRSPAVAAAALTDAGAPLVGDAAVPEGEAPSAAAIATGSAASSAAAVADAGTAPVAVPQTGEQCGNSVCAAGLVCCNASCGTCVPPGEKCSQLVCGMPVAPGSVACGSSTCNVGELCCNPSCGTCTRPGEDCDSARRCGSEIQFPESQMCGMQTCNVGLVCCNPSCGICAPAGEPCSQDTCS